MLRLLFSLSLITSLATQAQGSLEDLEFGAALYEYYQQDYFHALSRLESVRGREKLSVAAHEPELLRANMMLSLSLHEEAKMVFEQQLDSSTQQNTRDKLWFYLAKLFYQREEFDQVISLLATIDTQKLPEDLRDEFNYMVASALQHYGDLQAAEQYLSKLDKKNILTGYAYLNQAIAYMNNKSSGRFIQEMLIKSRAALNTSKEGYALQDKINLITGRFYLESGQSHKAAKTLRNVRLTGPYTDQALLSLGWALVDHWQYQEAMQPWYRLTKQYGLINPNRQEATLAISHILEKLQARTQALSGYKKAANQFEEELQQLKQVRESLATGEFLNPLLAQQPLQELGWRVPTKNQLDNTSIVIEYLEQFLADKAFQHEFTQLRDINSLNNILQRSLMDTQGYLEVIALREAGNIKLKKQQVLEKKQQYLGALKQRYQGLESLYQRAKQAESGQELADDKEWQQAFSVTRIQELLKILAEDHSKTRDLQAYRERLARVSGLLTWQLEEAHAERLWALRQQLDSLKQQINISENSLAVINLAMKHQPDHYGPVAAKLKAHETNILAKLDQVQVLMIEQKATLLKLADDSLNLHQDRISSYLMQSRLAIARLYDDAFTIHMADDSDKDEEDLVEEELAEGDVANADVVNAESAGQTP